MKENAGCFLILALIIWAAWYISEFHYQLMMLQGDSMSPSFHHMQLVILDKDIETYTYGDVIAFRCEGMNAVLVKRIAACQGDTVVIDGGILYVNGEVSTVFPPEKVFTYSGIANEEIQLGESSYFVIGDNILESKDSRCQSIGIVRTEDIIGKVLE